MSITDKSVIKWQSLKIKNLEDEILRLKTNLNGSEAVLQESIKEYMDEIVSKADVINELKNTIERQEIMIDKMKCCENCKHSTWSLISDCVECCHHKIELRNTCDEKYTNWEL